MKSFYVLSAVLAVVLGGLTAYYRSEPDTFYGIADTKEFVISSESPVEIRRIRVAQGQLVERGDTLIELHNPELELKIAQVSHELTELKSRKSAHATLSKAEIRQLKAQQEERVSEIRAEIKELEAQYEINRQLVSELRSLDKDKAAQGGEQAANPIQIKLASLRRMLELAQDPANVYEERLSHALSSSGDPLADQVVRLEDELRMLMEDRKRLVIPAQIRGLIGSVNFKAGEKVSPFAPILTLHAESPSFVRGYIHEDVHSRVAVRQKVKVQSSHDRGNSMEGVITGVGARIVEYPERLRKRSDILIWGREIIVHLPPGNRFLLGEKVLISLPDGKGFPGAKRSTEVSEGAEQAPEVSRAPEDIVSPGSAQAGLAAMAGLGGMTAEVPGVEASGLLFLPDMGKFLVISDDTPRKKPVLFLMDTAMRIEREAPIRGLDRIDDMEAISAGEDGAVYILASQSRTKGGKLPEARKLLVRAKRKGADLELDGKAVLLDMLEKASREHPGQAWAAFLRDGLAAGSIDIEGMAVHRGDLYLGFKNPLSEGRAVILKLRNPGEMFAGKDLRGQDVEIWKTLDLAGGDAGRPAACGIADLLFLDGDAYMISTGDVRAGGEESHVGELWVLRQGADKPERLRSFGGRKPEGIAYHDVSGGFFIAFDNGSGSPSQIMRIGKQP